MYGSNSYKNHISNNKFNIFEDKLETPSASEVDKAIKNLGIIPNVHRLVSSVVGVAYNIQATHGDTHLKRVETISAGLLQSKFCINTSTEKWYTENECSYILLSVPKQDCINDYFFFFKLNSKKYTGIPMRSIVSFISSMKLLIYCQRKIADMNRQLDSPVIDCPGRVSTFLVPTQTEDNIVHTRGNNLLMSIHMVIVVYSTI